ncbi:Sodium/hydrogen exchanger 5 [Lamellibrachia satsuma]|nr:Sodium/hydrogen exchanger 5 [Lamellibrachia satsuma]
MTTSPLHPATFPRSVRSVSNGGEDVANDTELPGNSHNAYTEGIKLISWHFHYVRLPLIISIFLIVTAICKLVFHAAEFLSSIVPESCLLICLGTLVGGTFHLLGGAKENFVNFSAQLFFLYLLPP